MASERSKPGKQIAPADTRRSGLLIIAAAAIALVTKLVIALNTDGTNDIYFFFIFARGIAQSGLQWEYANNVMFNHPPLVAYFLHGIYAAAKGSPSNTALLFPFLLRLPGIIADFLVVLLMLALRERWKIPAWGLALLALSPLSIMVSGFHGNTDPIVVLFVLLAACACVWQKPALSGAALALGCCIKIVPLLLLPAFLFFWLARRRALGFGVAFVVVVTTLSLEPLLTFPVLFAKRVVAYGSYWGIWGIPYWLRLTHWPSFDYFGFHDMPLGAVIVSSALKLMIVAGAILIAWRRRNEDARGLFLSIAYTWLLFFILAPGVGAQYLVWPMPFLLVFSPPLFATTTAAASCFVFFFYNTITGGLPWHLGISKDAITDRWAPWTVWPWLAFVASLVWAWTNTRRRNPELRLLSLTPTRDQPS